MNNEKVKEIKKALKCCIKLNNTKYTVRERQLACISCPYANKDECDVIISKNCLTLINELESENKELKKYKLDWLNSEKMHLQAEMKETEFELASSNRLFEIVSKENKQLKDRIAELERENERLANRITCRATIPDDKLEEIKKECLKRVEIAKDKLLKQFAERLKEKAVSFEGERTAIVSFNSIDETLKEFI